nr:reverse transcriptase domain-containing protein [Tanacetum cinerariifolium]
MKEMLRNCHGHNMSKGNIIKIFYYGLKEITQEVLNAAAGGIFVYKTPNRAYQLLKDKVLLKLDWAKNQKTKSSLKKTVPFAAEGSSNSDTNKIMALMDAMTMKIDAQYKDFQSRSKQSDLDDDDISISREEEAKFMQTFHRTRFNNDYRDRDFNRAKWRSSGRNDYNRDNYQSHSDDKPDLQKQLSDFIKAQHLTNSFKQLNLGVGTEGMIFLIDYAMKHSYSKDDTCFSIDVINEILEEDFDALLEEGSKILYSVEGTILKEKLFAEFDEFVKCKYPFDYRVTLVFGSIEGGLDPVSPVIRLPIERGINSGTRIGAMAGADINTLTTEQYLALLRENQAPSVVKLEIEGNVNFEINIQFFKNKNEDAHHHVDRVLNIGPIPGMTPTQALTAIQTIADHSQKWHDGTLSMSLSSSSNTDGLAAILSKLDSLGRDMNKLKENIHAIQVKEAKYGEFGRPTPFNGSNGEKYRVGPPGYYTRIDSRPPYGEKRPSLEELMNKHLKESARRSTKMNEWIKKL